MGDPPMGLKLTSPSYAEGQAIPERFTCKGADVSPPFAWSGVPRGARSLAFILDDPDAPGGTWTHWTFWNLPAAAKGLEEGADVTAAGAVQGRTSNGTQGYHGPCPPSGTHRYVATLYALSQPLSLQQGATAQQMRAAMTGRIVAQARLAGTFAATGQEGGNRGEGSIGAEGGKTEGPQAASPP